MSDDHRAREVFIYKVGLAQEDGTGNSGWRIVIATDSADPGVLLRTARLTLDDEMAIKWTRLAQVELQGKAYLDPEIAA